jgi:phospholipase/lecithinase/hemolysin
MGTYCMRKSSVLRWTLLVLIAAALATPTAVAGEMTFKSIVVFGDSLSDPGNDFALINAQNTPPYDNIEYLDKLIIPHVPYAKGGHHYSNGATWVEQFAKRRGLAQYVTPAWQSAGTKAANYAVGGARARDDENSIYINLRDQVKRFLIDVGDQAPSDALYVIEVGGNDIRDALAEYLNGNQLGGDTIIINALNGIGANIGILYEAGARKFLVWNVPDLGKTPAVIAMSQQTNVSYIVASFNSLLSMSLPTGIKLFNAFENVNKIVDYPGDYGLEVVNAACVTPKSAPFDCKEPDEYLFWDGIHPTKTAHGIIAQMVADVLAQ